MSTAEIEVVEAFTSIGILPEKAMAAAAALNRRDALAEIGVVRKDISPLQAEMRNDISALQADVRKDISALQAGVRTDISALQADTNLLKWMVSFLVAMAVAILVKQFVH